jgi:hypothetical protein
MAADAAVGAEGPQHRSMLDRQRGEHDDIRHRRA